ncbi:MAG: lysophospholipid acyltransferase family protein [Gemmatimonas sp.]
MLYEALKPIVRIALRWYYRSITLAGVERIPTQGPVFLAVNHPNALVDALVVAGCLERRVRFTAKSTIFSNPIAAAFFRAAGVVPLRRAADERRAVAAQPAAGSVDAASGVATIEAAPGTATRALDPSRNSATFEYVADALAQGAAIVILPEGISHDAPQLAPLRTGLARMVRMAQHERGVRGIRVVPIGLLFEQKEEPRSRVLMQVGEPLDVDTFQGGDASVASLTDAVTERLAAVTLNFESADDARRIRLVGDTLGALVEPLREISDDVVPLSATLSLVRRIDRAHRLLRSGTQPGAVERIAAFEARLLAFRNTLELAHVDVHDLAIERDAASGVRFTIRETVIAALLLPFVAWGRLTHFVPVRLARALATRNVTSREDPAMRTLVGGVVLVLLSYAVLTALVGAIAGPWWALLFFASLVPSASSDFRYGDRFRRAQDRARAYLRFRRDPSLQRALVAEADWLRSEAAALERLATG